MNRAIEKCAKLLFKSHRKLRNSQKKIFVRFFFAHPLVYSNNQPAGRTVGHIEPIMKVAPKKCRKAECAAK